MHGRPAGGFAAMRPYTPQEIAAQTAHDLRCANERRILPHAVCSVHGATKRDGSPKAFLVKYACQDDGTCSESDWTAVPCPTPDKCLHGT